MARDQQKELNAHFATKQADVETKVVLLEDGFNTLEATLRELMALMQRRGTLAPDAELIVQFDRAIGALREAGLRKRQLPGAPQAPGVHCPGCKALLRNITGAAGDRCDWCGHIFILHCPACDRPLPDLSGSPGEVCLGCQHHF